jgi:hypothetical protein
MHDSVLYRSVFGVATRTRRSEPFVRAAGFSSTGPGVDRWSAVGFSFPIRGR